MNKPVYYKILLFILVFYLLAQTFQFTIRLGALSPGGSLEEDIIKGQHPLNYVRRVLILLSMFLMVPGFTILSLHFYRKSWLASIVAVVFFIFFCLFEISYRSVELFQATAIWGREFVQVIPQDKARLLSRFQLFNDTIDAIYFPLLSSLLIGSLCICYASFKRKSDRLVTVAMGVSAVQQVARLSGYTGSDLLAFLGRYYFPIVTVTFVLLIVWTIKASRDMRHPANMSENAD